MKTYAIMGATGHIGKVLIEDLLKKGHQVHAIGRDKNKLQSLKEKGAKIFPIAAFDDLSTLAQAFAGCQAIFSFIPPIYQEKDNIAFQDRVGNAIKEALLKAKNPYVVNLSSIGADLQKGTGPIIGLQHLEKQLDAIAGLNVLHLRPTFFMENLLWSIPLIKNFGFMGSLLRADKSVPMVATYDIALKAAEFLDTLNFKGHTVFEFIGPREITMGEAAKIIGKAIGKPDLPYRQLIPQEAEKGMKEAGMGMEAIKLLIEMYQTMNEGEILITKNMTSEHIGKTTIEEFALKVFAPQIMSAEHR